jgi:hypothetical protein
MADQTFEARLQDAFDRYLEAAPMSVDAASLAAVIARQRPVAVRPRLTSRPSFSPRFLLLAGALLLMLTLTFLAAGGYVDLRSIFTRATPTIAPAPTTAVSTPGPNPTEAPGAAGLGASGTIFINGSCRLLIDAATGDLTNDCTRNEYPVGGGGTASGPWTWSPDARLGAGDDTAALAWYDTSTGQRRPIPGTDKTRPELAQQTSFVGWSPRSTYIVWIGESVGANPWAMYIGTLAAARGQEVPSTGDGGYWCCLIWSGDETRLIVPTGEVMGRLANGDGSPLPGAREFDPAGFLALANDGGQIAIRASRGPGASPVGDDILVGDGFTPPTLRWSLPDGVFASAGAWSGDGSTLGVVATRVDLETRETQGHELWTFKGSDTPAHVELTLSGPLEARPQTVVWSSDDAYLIVRSQEPPESYREWATVVARSDGASMVVDAGGAAFSADGRFAVYDAASPAGNVDFMVVELETGRTARLTHGAPPNGYQVAWLE